MCRAASGNAGSPLTLPSPAQRRQGGVDMPQDATEPACPRLSMSVAAAMSPDTAVTGCTEPPSTLASMSQVSRANPSASSTRPRAHWCTFMTKLHTI